MMGKTLEIEDNYDKSGKDNKCHKWIRSLLRERIILSLILVVSLLMFIAVLTIRHFSRSNNEKWNVVSEEDPTTIGPTLPNELILISRAEWQARPSVDQLDPVQNPVPYVIILHTGTQACSDQDTCSRLVRAMQNFHIDVQTWWDIAYNFLVGGDGFAYEGRGWTSLGTHTAQFNSRSMGIAFIGNFSSQLPPISQIHACKALIAAGVNSSYIDKNYKLLAARQVSNTEAPGQALYEELKTWPHWSPTP